MKYVTLHVCMCVYWKQKNMARVALFVGMTEYKTKCQVFNTKSDTKKAKINTPLERGPANQQRQQTEVG